MPEITDMLSRVLMSLLTLIWNLAIIMVLAVGVFVGMIAMMIFKIRKG